MPARHHPGVVALILILIVASHPGLAQSGDAPTQLPASDRVQVTAVAVATTEQGDFVGVAADVQARAIGDGSGRVFVDTKPLAQTDMQGSARLAARVAASALGLDWTQYDHTIVFRSESPVIGGPSAGAVMALALAATLQDLAGDGDPWTLDPAVAVTGTIHPDGTIGPVGGIPEKATGARNAGIRLFLYPAGQELALARDGGFQRWVHMDDHCESLGITCRAVATLDEVIEAASGVRLVRLDPPTPQTADYAAILEPTVSGHVTDLNRRLDEATQLLQQSGLSGSDANRVQSSLDVARDRLEDAQRGLAEGRYYQAATWAFQGAIWVGHAELLVPFLNGGRDGDRVAAAVDACHDAVDAAHDLVSSQQVDDWTDFYALGAAQERVRGAQELLDQADRLYSTGFRLQDWLDSLFQSSFCMERAATVTWWAGLADPEQGTLSDEVLHAVAEDALEQARDLVQYAEAVLGMASDASEALTNAQRAYDTGWLPAAVFSAVTAQTQASLAVQQGGASQEIPTAILEAAQGTAAQAIQRARAAGAEPILSVSLFELSQSQSDPALALGNLWDARSLALLAAEPASAPPPSTEPGRIKVPDPRGAYTEEALQTALVMGVIVGASAVLVMMGLAVSLRRR